MRQAKQSILKGLVIIAGILTLSSTMDATAAVKKATTEPSFTQYVDTKIGSGGHGHVFVGANVPFGMVQLGPTSIPQDWDWCSGYHESDSTVIGFSHTHLSGTGIGDLFDITVMPVAGKGLTYARGRESKPQSGLWSYADRSQEITKPGYYSVPLTRFGIIAELTATSHVGMHRYTFPNNDDVGIVIDLMNGGCWDRTMDAFIEVVDPKTGKPSPSATIKNGVAVRGYRYSRGWADDQKIYFYAEFSKPFNDVDIQTHDIQVWQNEFKDMSTYAHVHFEARKGEQIMMKVALSSVSMEGAYDNMKASLLGWDFDKTAADAEALWNKELSRIQIETTDEDARKIFYTSLYHTMIAPSEFSDVDGTYRGADGKIYASIEHKTHTTFSLWDTYRAAMPLYSIFQPDVHEDLISSMLRIYDEQGKLPVWHLHGCETNCMVGNPGIMPIADAIVKGCGGFDRHTAYEAMKASALKADRGQDHRMKYGYIPCDLFNESVAYDLEYAIADASIAAAAKFLADRELDTQKAAYYKQEYEFFLQRSKSYKHLFDKETGFIRGKDSHGNFREDYSPFASTHRADDYCEGNGWQYTWLVPHDVKGLMECFGGKDEFIKKLDSLFIVSSQVEGFDSSPDISGLIGQYAHGNEPSHHILYLYSMIGQPWKTADRVREVLNTLYTAQPDGLSGNEDVGQMSAWYIMSSMGFYQVEPGSGRYWFGVPNFKKVSINVGKGQAKKFFTIQTDNASAENRYIQSVRLNGKAYTKGYIEHKDIMNGGKLVFKMGPRPKVWFCANEPTSYEDRRPRPEDRLFKSRIIEQEIAAVVDMLENPRLKWMFANCFPNTLDTAIHFSKDTDGQPDTYVYTGDIPAMWLRDSGAQVWPYLLYVTDDSQLKAMIKGVIRRQFKCICIDPYANAFNVEPMGQANKTDRPVADPYVFERKWELDSHCYPIRLAYEYWQICGDDSIFDKTWIEAMEKILATMKEQQRKDGPGSYRFLRVTDRQLDTKCVIGRGNPVNPVGLIASAFRPSDDATTFEFHIPSNFMAVSSLRKAADILSFVNDRQDLADECLALANEVEQALKKYAVVQHPVYGKIYAYEIDGYGSYFLMDDANVPSLLSMSYLGDVPANDPIYQNTRRFVWSEANPYFFRGAAGEGIGGPHIMAEVIWPMSIMMRAFTSNNDDEIRECICQLMTTDAGTGLMHESFYRNDSDVYTREWFAWQNSLFGELILKIINDGRLHVLNSIR